MFAKGEGYQHNTAMLRWEDEEGECREGAALRMRYRSALNERVDPPLDQRRRGAVRQNLRMQRDFHTLSVIPSAMMHV